MGLILQEAPAALVEHCSRRRATAHTSTAGIGRTDPAAAREVIEWMADHGAFDDYESWCGAGMVLKLEFGDAGLSLWRLTHDRTVTEDVEKSKWVSFAGDADGCSPDDLQKIGTLIKQARKMGWTGHLRSSAAWMFRNIPNTTSPPLAPSDPKPALIKSSGEFIRDFVPPDYILDGVLQRGFCYSMTAKTGTGKTAVAMCFSAHVATGQPLNGLAVAKGEVIYLAGENPTDIQMRWLGLTREMKIDPKTVPVYFLPGVISISQNVATISKEITDRKLQPALIVVDTAAAYFEGDNENDNVQQGNNARLLRSMTTLPGGPCVLILCHPTKRAQDDDLLPRGGGAFLNEVDGNIALKSNDTLIGAEVQGKFRGPAFPPLTFKLDAVRDHPLLKDSKGRNIPTVIARSISDGEMASNVATQERDENRLLQLIEKHPKASLTELANMLGAKTSKSKVDRLVQKLINTKLIRREGRKLVLTQIGEKELNELEKIVSPSFQGPLSGMPFPPLPMLKK